MTKRIFLFVLIALIALLGSSRAQAAGLPGKIYFDTSLTSNGTGTSASPYNNLTDAINKAHSLSGGAYIYEKQNGRWRYWGYISPVVSGGTGLPLPTVTLYILLAVAALVMVITGLQLRRRSRQLQH